MNNPNQNPSDPFSSDSDEDRQLVSFLKANRPPVPAPPPHEEALLMQQIAQAEVSGEHQVRSRAPKRRWNPAVFIGIGVVLLGGLTWQLRQWNAPLYADEDTELEDFLLSTWGGLSSPEEMFSEWNWASEEDPVAIEPSLSDSVASYPPVKESTP